MVFLLDSEPDFASCPLIAGAALPHRESTVILLCVRRPLPLCRVE